LQLSQLLKSLFLPLDGKNKIYRQKISYCFNYYNSLERQCPKLYENYFRISRTKIDWRLISISIDIYVRLFFFFLNIFCFLKDRILLRTHIELLYTFEILTITDKKNVIGQSETCVKLTSLFILKHFH